MKLLATKNMTDRNANEVSTASISSTPTDSYYPNPDDSTVVLWLIAIAIAIIVFMLLIVGEFMTVFILPYFLN